MSVPAPMTLYDGTTAIGEIVDHCRGRVEACDFSESGPVSLGFFPTRKDAMRAISARHGSRPEPPKAA